MSKRQVHLLFNVLGTVIFLVISMTLPFAEWVVSLSPENMRLQIAIVHVAVSYTHLLTGCSCSGIYASSSVK